MEKIPVYYLIFAHQVLSDYVTSDQYAAVHVSSSLNFTKTLYENIYPLRLTDGLYGIGAWSEKIEFETIFIGYEDDETFDFTSWISASGSLGCNSSHYSHVQELKKDKTSDQYIGTFTYQILRKMIIMILRFIITYLRRNNVCINTCITCNIINGTIFKIKKSTFLNVKSCCSKRRM